MLIIKLSHDIFSFIDLPIPDDTDNDKNFYYNDCDDDKPPEDNWECEEHGLEPTPLVSPN